MLQIIEGLASYIITNTDFKELFKLAGKKITEDFLEQY